ncbi:hypothetical protein F5Y11DRAFT_310085 [Daldinia sp. FL1419]|nr:hypothetical protein F5Y11DRAFT_310085 [Daldinia sp. FL1419]
MASGGWPNQHECEDPNACNYCKGRKKGKDSNSIGLCGMARCNERLSTTSRRYCDYHRAKISETNQTRAKELRDERRAQGTCVECGGTMSPNSKSYCNFHYDRKRSYHDRLKAGGRAATDQRGPEPQEAEQDDIFGSSIAGDMNNALAAGLSQGESSIIAMSNDTSVDPGYIYPSYIDTGAAQYGSFVDDLMGYTYNALATGSTQDSLTQNCPSTYVGLDPSFLDLGYTNDLGSFYTTMPTGVQPTLYNSGCTNQYQDPQYLYYQSFQSQDDSGSAHQGSSGVQAPRAEYEGDAYD